MILRHTCTLLGRIIPLHAIIVWIVSALSRLGKNKANEQTYFCVREGCVSMLITGLELENIKSYQRMTVQFQRGTTAISGANGAGKTTLVEAIGFALFDSMPYKQEQFIREGEKYGKVVVHLLGNDDRPYVVERRCGSGALWTLNDCEADLRLEQRADVQDKLHELFGIERERSLASLFQDALGVPQGTFTAIFLQPPRARKQTFDALLQIEDYGTAATYLLEAQRQYKEQGLTQDREIQRLTFETRDLDTWRTALKAARERDQELITHNAALVHQLSTQQTYFEQLKQRQVACQQCEAELRQHKLLHANAYQQWEQATRSLHEARAAHQAVVTHEADHQRYSQAEAMLTQLRRAEHERHALSQRHARLSNTQATMQVKIQYTQQHVARIAEARQRVLDLLPAVEQQGELETRIATVTQQAQQYEYLRKEGVRLHQLREKCQQEQRALQQRIVVIEPLQSLAEQLHERVTRVAQLEAQSTQRGAKRLQMEEKQQLWQEKKNDLEQTAAKLRKAEDVLTKIEEHRQEAEEYPRLLQERHELDLRQSQLQGSIESYRDSRTRSAGGQCPLLHQVCLNIKQQGVLSLEAYFDDLLTTEQAQLHEVAEQLIQLEQRSGALKKYAEALDKLGQYSELRNGYVEHIEKLNVDMRRVEREKRSLQEEWEALKHIDQEIVQARAEREESRAADQQVRQLAGLRSQVEQFQGQIEQYSAELDELRCEAEPLKQSREQLQTLKQALLALNDPRSASRAAQEEIKLEATYQQQLQQAQETLQEITRHMDELASELATYAYLDSAINEQETAREQAVAGHQTYLKNIEVAGRLPEREQTCTEAQQRMEQAAATLALIEEAYQQAVAAFDQQEFAEVEREIRQLEHEITRLASEMQNGQQRINELEQYIATAEALLVELEAAEQEKRTLDDLTTMMEQFRKLIKEAAPHVLHAILNDISAEANRIFGEIMGDRSVRLNWTDDYEITLVRQGLRRSFAQLSGGEQMSAALAVRLALLKKLSTINIAFFDEPTQNMDEQRRTNLAEQIRRVRGFDQLLVISHDDTFEQNLDSLIRLHKQDGQTRQLHVGDDMLAVEHEVEQVHSYAS